ncbi:hypothetical protein L1987_83643 [Smallanthus sonchifolius]|uniref:Uncharacterized protein n=1 Tax=Smallanthus sonchifolius TaxID=185202 RepID=A0ACB8YDE3_9ASTR|nr:hypothetical protein L1987_83643 [Smallanthus sonchifolius]
MDGRFKIKSIVFRFCPGFVLNFLLFGFCIQGLHIKSRNSRISIRVEEKIEKELVVCVSDKDEDPVKVIAEVDFGYVDGESESEGVIRDSETVGACQVFDEMPERTKLNDDVEHESSAIDDSEVKLDEEDEVFEGDWQGIETTELEMSFEAAVAFVDSKGSVDCINLIGNEVKALLYGLYRVAIKGSCFEPQPMALNVSAHANGYVVFRHHRIYIYLNMQTT